MTYEQKRAEAGRQPLIIVELELDTCPLSFGVSPCTASAAVGSECYNTFATCQDQQNYAGRFGGTVVSSAYNYIELQADAPNVDDVLNGAEIRIVSGTGRGQPPLIATDYVGSTRRIYVDAFEVVPDTTSEYRISVIKTYRHCSPVSPLPSNIAAVPDVLGFDLTPATIEPSKGLGRRGTARVDFQDGAHHDIGIDPYYATRGYSPIEQGTYWGKLKARNRYYLARLMRIITGYITPGAITSAPASFDWDDLENFLASDSQPQAGFARYAVDLSGDGQYFIAGAQLHDVSGQSNAGQAYIYAWTGGGFGGEQILNVADAGDRDDNDNFGISVALTSDGTRAAVACVNDNDVPTPGFTGSVYIFTRSGATWSLTTKLYGFAGDGFTGFGYNCRWSPDDTVFVASGDDGTGLAGSGCIYVYDGATYAERQKLKPAELLSSDYLGRNGLELSAAGGIIVGYTPDGGFIRGAIYVYRRTGDTWTYVQKLTEPGGQVNNNAFGQALALSDDGMTLLAGTPGADNPTGNQGAVYVYNWDGAAFVHVDTLRAPVEYINASFGGSVGISADGTTAIVGAPVSDAGAINAGAVYAYTLEGGAWVSHGAKWGPSTPPADCALGRVVAIDAAATVAVAGHRDTVAGSHGRAYVFDINKTPGISLEATPTIDLVNDARAREYVIDRIEGPDYRGRVRVVGKDPLSLADEKHALVPKPSEGALDSSITEVSSTLDVGTGQGAAYPATGHCMLGREVMAFTRSGDTFTITRAQWGTAAASHTAGATVQLCADWTDQNCVDVLKDLLYGYTQIPPQFIPESDWELERTNWLSLRNVTVRETKPRAVIKVVNELAEQCGFDLVWNDTAQQIKLAALKPPTGVPTTLTDGGHIVEDSLEVSDDSKEQATTIIYYYDRVDVSEGDDPENYASWLVVSNLTLEDPAAYDISTTRQIYARHVTSDLVANVVASRLLARFGQIPRVVTLVVDAKDGEILVTNEVLLQSRAIQDSTGGDALINMQVVERKELDDQSRVRLRLLSSAFETGGESGGGLYGYVCSVDSAAVEYSAATMEQQERQPGAGWAGENSGSFGDGRPSYRII